MIRNELSSDPPTLGSWMAQKGQLMKNKTIDRANKIFGIILALALLLVLPGNAIQAQQDLSESIKIGVLAKRGVEQCQEKWQPTAEYLTNKIPGYSFEIEPLKHKKFKQAVEKGEMDFVLTNSASYVELEKFYGVSRIATLNNLHMGRGYTVYGGVIFCRADRKDLRRLEDIKGKTFMAADEMSFGGWLMAWRELKEHGIDPYEDFTDLSFGGTHDAVVYAVQEGKVDAGTVRTDALEQLEAEGKINLKNFYVFSHDHTEKYACEFPFFHSTDTYPEWPFARLRHTPDELAKKVTVALLEMSPDDPAAKAARCVGWTIPHNYQPVHECLKYLRVSPYKDYGKVTLRDVFRQYWPWLLGIVIAIIIIAMFVFRIVRLSQRLQESISAKKKELVQRKQAEDALRVSEERFRTIFETAEDSIFIKDSSLRYTMANPAMERLFGMHVSQIIGKTDSELFGEEAAEHIQDADTRVLNGEILREEHTKPINEVATTFNVVKVPIRDADGNIIGLCGIARDVTDRKKAETERELLIEQMEERMKELRCLYLIAESISTRSAIEDIFYDIVMTIPYGFQHPLIARARIRYDDKEYVWQPFDETEWKLASDLVVNGEKRGSLEVYYLEQQFEMKDGPFLQEEHKLVDAIAKTLSKAIERLLAEVEIRTKVRELEEFNRLSVGRELRMIELKKEINQLLDKSGSTNKYEIVS